MDGTSRRYKCPARCDLITDAAQMLIVPTRKVSVKGRRLFPVFR